MIYFAFKSSNPEDLRETNIGASVDYEYLSFGGMLFGIVHSHNYKARAHVDNLDSRLMTMPGAAVGVLTQRHVDHIAKAFPNAKKNDAMSTVLSAIYQATGHEGFNPNHH